MFALHRVPSARTAACGDELAAMAHALGCRTLVEEDRRARPLIARPRRPILDKRSRLHRELPPKVRP